MSKLNHRADVVRVGPILPHPNADNLEITHVEGYQCVIGKGSMKEGDLAVYIQPDSVVPQTEAFRFIWNDHVGLDGKVPERRRRITVRRFRKEYSEGLLMPVADLSGGLVHNPDMAYGWLEVGQDVAPILGIEHYIPEFDRASTAADTAQAPKRRYPKTLKGWFFFALHRLGLKGAGRSLAIETGFHYPIYDVDALKKRKSWIQDGDRVQVTEKIHGSNGRYVFVEGTQYCGSHEQWKKDGNNVWWNVFRQFPQIGKWCQENPGKVLYGEVGPTQKHFNYGTTAPQTFFFAFDVWDDKTRTWTWAGDEGFTPTVPQLGVIEYSADGLKAYVDGPSVVPGAKHMREGVVIRKLDGSGIALKVVSNAFLEKDSK